MTKEQIPKWVEDYYKADYKSSAGKAVKYLYEQLSAERERAAEYTKSIAIKFDKWKSELGYFMQMNNDRQFGYIRQENQLLFSKWKSPEELYEIFIQTNPKRI